MLSDITCIALYYIWRGAEATDIGGGGSYARSLKQEHLEFALVIRDYLQESGIVLADYEAYLWIPQTDEGLVDFELGSKPGLVDLLQWVDGNKIKPRWTWKKYLKKHSTHAAGKPATNILFSCVKSYCHAYVTPDFSKMWYAQHMTEANRWARTKMIESVRDAYSKFVIKNGPINWR